MSIAYCKKCSHHFIDDKGLSACQYGYMKKGKLPKSCPHHNCRNCEHHYIDSRGVLNCQYGHIAKGKQPRWCLSFEN